MDADKIIMIVCFAVSVVLYVFALYEKVKGNATAATAEMIAQAEKTGLLGPEKMALVVGWLYERIPDVFKKILNKEALEKIAQGIFDYMRKYAVAYVDFKEDKPDAIHDVNTELAADLVHQLEGLGEVGLKNLAVQYDIDVTGMKMDEIISAILVKMVESN